MREIGENYTTLHNILQPRKGKEVGQTKMGQELGLQVTGSGKYGPLVCGSLSFLLPTEKQQMDGI